MPDKPNEVTPQTAGDLRRLIASKGLSWTVDARFQDSDRLPKYARGGQEERNVSPSPTIVQNVAEYIRQHPPTNPFMRAHWVALKLLPPENEGYPGGGSTPQILNPPKER